VVCVAAGALTYVGLVQPYLSRGSTIGWVAGTAAVAFAIRAAIGAVFQRSSYVFPDPLPFHDVGTAGFVHVGGAQVQARAFFVAGLAIALALGSAWFLDRTRHGQALRAVADDQEGARFVGVPVDLAITLAFAGVGAVAMVAALAAAPGEAVNANTGTLLGLQGLVAALAVRFGPPLRAFAAGLVLGVVEAAIANVHLGGWQLGPSYSQVLPIAFVLLLISLRPSQGALEERE
jgi:branched-subunit amino acid ABC-type transport system permease component